MTNPSSVNVPPADLMASFIRRADESPYSNHPVLLLLKPQVLAASAKMLALIGQNEKGTAYETAKAAARLGDERFDDTNRFARALLGALALHPDAALATAAKYLDDVLYPEGLTVIQLSFELEAASGTTFAKRLAQPRVRECVQTLSVEVPSLAAHLDAVVAAASALGEALKAFDGVLVDQAGRPVNPELFKARTEAQRLFSQFLAAAETFAYPDDSTEHKRAREALGGPYRRFLAVDASKSEPAPAEPTPTPAPTT